MPNAKRQTATATDLNAEHAEYAENSVNPGNPPSPRLWRASGKRQRPVPSRDRKGASALRSAECGLRIEKQRITGRWASGGRQRREPFDLNGLASLWLVLGCEFAPLTRGRLWVSPELPVSAELPRNPGTLPGSAVPGCRQALAETQQNVPYRNR